MVIAPLLLSLVIADVPPQGNPVPPVAVRFADVTGNGELDKLLLGQDGSLRIAVHVVGRTYRTIKQDLPSVLAQEVLVTDLDGDGWDDLYLVSLAANVALWGDGTGRFRDVTAELGLADAGPGVSAERIDLDADGHADLLLHNATGDVLFWARGDGTFDRDESTPENSSAGGLPPVTFSNPEDGAGLAGDSSGPVPPPGASNPLTTPLSGPTAGSDQRVSGTTNKPPAIGGAPPPVVILPELESILDDKYVNDNAGEVDSADIADGSLTGPDISTSLGDVTFENGNVGIGTANPLSLLDVTSTGEAELNLRGDSISSAIADAVLTLSTDGGTSSAQLRYVDNFDRLELINFDETGELYLGTDGVAQITITSSGDVGIGTNSPTEKLDIIGDVLVTGSLGVNKTPSIGIAVLDVRTSGSEIIAIQAENISPFGSAATFSSNSSSAFDPTLRLEQNSTGAFMDCRNDDGNLFRILGTGKVIATELELGGDVLMQSTGDVELLIAADTDNVNEQDQPVITLSQDGGSVQGRLGYFNGTNDLTLKTLQANNFYIGTNDTLSFSMDTNGDVGIGLSNPPNAVAKLEVEENDAQGGTSGAALYAHNEATTGGIGIWSETNGTDACMVVDQDGSGPIIKGFRGGGILVFEVRNSGRVVTTALQITGGGDLVEGFDTTDQDCEPGMVMAIDPDHPGQLTVSTSPYDRKVAGVISGAGNIKHGIRMGQDGVLDGETLVAMVGRVYVRCTTENGPIVPGDRLTTSNLRGHAMKATEAGGSPGAVIGKAMSGLDEGTGLVLVLVNLQ
jgi:hypothetical protein